MHLCTVIKQTIVLQVLHGNNGIGEVQIPLWQLNLATETNEWKALHKVTGTQGKVGFLVV